MNADMIKLIAVGVLILFAAIVFIVEKRKSANRRQTVGTSTQGNDKSQKSTQVAYKKNSGAAVNKEDIFKFMEFDKIQDNMIIQNNGTKFTAVIKCKGINYNLMSEVEQLSVEEGFINFLNTLKFPIQLYVQAQNIDLKENINKYKESLKNVMAEYDDLNTDYNIAVNSLESTDEEIEEVEKRRNRALNVLEYGQDIVRYVEKLSLNKNMLQRNFYVLVSYYKAEITGASSFKSEEILDICYSELFTRVQNILSGLSMSSVTGEALKSNDIAELLYSSYNRDDHNFMKVREALESGFHRLYSTSEDAITKKQEMLLESIREEAEYKAVQALAKAVEEGNVVTPQDIEDTYDQESSKQALDIIKHERIDDSVKDKAKKIVINEYKENKKIRLKQKQEVLEQSIEGMQQGEQNSEPKENVVDIEVKDEPIEETKKVSTSSETDETIV